MKLTKRTKWLKTSAAWLLALAIPWCGPLVAAETGVDNDVIMIGQSCAVSGPAAELGSEMRLGAQLYFNEVNQRGGVNGRQIRLITLDDGYEPERAAANTRKLINEERVFALFGYVGTPTSNAALPIFSEARVPFFGAFTGAESLRSPFNRYIFNVRASYYDETEKIVEQLTSLGVRNIAVFYQDDAYGKAGLAGVERALGRRNLKVSATATVERNTVKVEAAVKEMMSRQPDAIVMVSAYKSVAAFVKGARQAGYTGQFHNVSFVGSRALSNELGNEGYGVAISQVVPFPFSADTQLARDYQRAMKSSSGAPLSFTSFEGYIAARVFVEGLRRTGRDLTRERFVSALEGMTNVDLGGYLIRFSPRKPGSVWSQVNLRHVARLEKEGRMTAAGRAVFEKRDPKKVYEYSYELRLASLSPEYTKRLSADRAAHADFSKRPPYYRQAVYKWIMTAKQEATRERRFATLLDCSRRGVKVPPLDYPKPSPNPKAPKAPQASKQRARKPRKA